MKIRSRAGVIAALEPIMDVLKNESEQGEANTWDMQWCSDISRVWISPRTHSNNQTSL
ncbi:MAG: hypothetical protein ACJZ1Y_01915 [Candidatus Neomarinimicrobiota bacterium]